MNLFTISSKAYDGIHDDKAASPEERLWMAVVEAAVYDFRLVLDQIKRDLERTGMISRSYVREVEKLRHEFSTRWFGEICEMAGVHQSKVVALLVVESRQLGVGDPKVPVYDSLKMYSKVRTRDH